MEHDDSSTPAHGSQAGASDKRNFLQSMGFARDELVDSDGQESSDAEEDVALSSVPDDLDVPGSAPSSSAARVVGVQVESTSRDAKREGLSAENESLSADEMPSPSNEFDSNLLELSCPKCDGDLVLHRDHVGVEGACVWCDVRIVAARSGVDGEVKVFPLETPDTDTGAPEKNPEQSEEEPSDCQSPGTGTEGSEDEGRAVDHTCIEELDSLAGSEASRPAESERSMPEIRYADTENPAKGSGIEAFPMPEAAEPADEEGASFEPDFGGLSESGEEVEQTPSPQPGGPSLPEAPFPGGSDTAAATSDFDTFPAAMGEAASEEDLVEQGAADSEEAASFQFGDSEGFSEWNSDSSTKPGDEEKTPRDIESEKEGFENETAPDRRTEPDSGFEPGSESEGFRSFGDSSTKGDEVPETLDETPAADGFTMPGFAAPARANSSPQAEADFSPPDTGEDPAPSSSSEAEKIPPGFDSPAGSSTDFLFSEDEESGFPASGATNSTGAAPSSGFAPAGSWPSPDSESDHEESISAPSKEVSPTEAPVETEASQAWSGSVPTASPWGEPTDESGSDRGSAFQPFPSPEESAPPEESAHDQKAQAPAERAAPENHSELEPDSGFSGFSGDSAPSVSEDAPPIREDAPPTREDDSATSSEAPDFSGFQSSPEGSIGFATPHRSDASSDGLSSESLDSDSPSADGFGIPPAPSGSFDESASAQGPEPDVFAASMNLPDPSETEAGDQEVEISADTDTEADKEGFGSAPESTVDEVTDAANTESPPEESPFFVEEPAGESIFGSPSPESAPAGETNTSPPAAPEEETATPSGSAPPPLPEGAPETAPASEAPSPSPFATPEPADDAASPGPDGDNQKKRNRKDKSASRGAKGPRKGLVILLVVLVGFVCGAALASFVLPVDQYVLEARAFMEQKFDPAGAMLNQDVLSPGMPSAADAQP